MSWQSLADVFAYVQRTDDLTTAEVVVLLAIANHTNEYGTGAFPSRPLLMTLTKLSRTTLRCTIRSLEKRGVLTTMLWRGRRGRQVYTLHVPAASRKGTPTGPLASKKGTAGTPKKGRLPSPDPFTDNHVPPEKLKAILASLDVSPDSRIYQWTLNVSDEPNDNGDHS
jgi:hypothetical protein